jgi:glycosyltransferase involved in cell wall biosynthesis
MSLSILCVTNYQFENAERFIKRMFFLANEVHAEMVLGLDREKAQKSGLTIYADKVVNLTANTLQEDVMDEAIRACSGDYVFRLDDDETVSPALLEWLTNDGYLTGNLYSFPRVYLYPDEHHYLNNPGMFPDLQTRLGKKELMYGCNHIHAGNPNGAGTVIPYAIEHHKLIARSFRERNAIANHYEAIRAGAGTLPQYARYNLPELFYPELLVEDYIDGDFSAR